MDSPINNRTERVNFIEQMLFRSPNGLRAVEIASACGVDRRTIYRDLSVLAKTVPIFQKDGRFFLNTDYYLANLRLNLTEAVTVMIALRMLFYHHEGNPHAVSVLRKLGAILPEFPALHSTSMAQSLWGIPIDRAYVSVLETVIRGWGEQRIIKLWDGEATLEFATYFVEPSATGSVYALGLDVDTKQLLTFKLSQIKRAKLLKLTYSIPPHYDLEYLTAHLRKTSGDTFTSADGSNAIGGGHAPTTG